MKQHDFIPLVTFRGVSESSGKFVYGSLICNKTYTQIVDEHSIHYEVDKDSLGIYIGKDDKNCTPIFCGVAGAKYGSDIISHRNGVYPIRYHKQSYSFDTSLSNYVSDQEEIPDYDMEVISNQCEQHLKENK